jgi:hypothetical protein
MKNRPDDWIPPDSPLKKSMLGRQLHCHPKKSCANDFFNGLLSLMEAALKVGLYRLCGIEHLRNISANPQALGIHFSGVPCKLLKLALRG